jgi:predicted ribosomally synthesized peptide with SipW-like signal peptide
VLAACLGLLFTAFSYFNDTEASAGNAFRVGTWAVDVEGGGDSASCIFQSLVSGDNGTETFTVTNTGTVSAYVDVVTSISESGTGNLHDYLMAHLFVLGGDDIYVTAPIRNIGGSYDSNILLSAGESRDITLDWYVKDGYFQDLNDRVEFTISFIIQPTP